MQDVSLCFTTQQATQRSGISYDRSSSFGNTRTPSSASLANAAQSGLWGNRDIPLLSRAEAMASTAVRAADKVQVIEAAL